MQSTRVTKSFLPVRILLIYRWVSILLAGALLTGCLAPGSAFSPEGAAQQAVLDQRMMDIHVDANSIRVLQRYDLDGRILVLVGYQGRSPTLGASTCEYLYEVRREVLGGWSTGSGGGGCTHGEAAAEQQEPLTIGATRTSGGRPLDIGYSVVSGLVYAPTIRTVRVTWADGRSQDVEVINGSYLAARNGQIDMQQVEGLDESGAAVHDWQKEIAPEKLQDEG